MGRAAPQSDGTPSERDKGSRARNTPRPGRHQAVEAHGASTQEVVTEDQRTGTLLGEVKARREEDKEGQVTGKG